MSDQRGVTSPKCQICGKGGSVMKRCTRCQSVFYCSRSCQVQDWSIHKQHCKTNKYEGSPSGTEQIEKNPESGVERGNDIWNDTDFNLSKGSKPRTVHIKTYHKGSSEAKSAEVDFQTAFDKLKNTHQEHGACSAKSAGTYLHNNKVRADLPLLDTMQPSVTIAVKSNKQKLNIILQKDWSSSEMFKFIAHKTEIPLDRLKLIHKGKFITDENLGEVVYNKAVLQAIGEKAESEEGIESNDIDVLMKQLAVDRNDAVKALKQNSDVVDAILYLGNK